MNPQKNYAQFLLRALLPMIIHVVITLAAGYSVGSEFRRRDAREWLESAGGDPVAALAGKLAPLFCIFIFIMLVEPLFLEGVLQVPFKGDLPLMIAAGSLLIIAYLSLGALLQLLALDLATGLGLAGLIASPAFGYAGVGFPTIGMNAFAQSWSAILPLRWYMAVTCWDRRHADCRSRDFAVPFAALAGLARAVLPVSHCCAWRASSARAGVEQGPTCRASRHRQHAARHRRRLYGEVAPHARNAGRLQRAVSRSACLRHLLSATLSQPDPSQASDRGCRQRSERAQPQIVETLDASGALSVAVRRARLRRHAAQSIAGRLLPPSRSCQTPSATCSRASPLTSRSTRMPRTCSYSDRPQVRCRYRRRSTDVRPRFARRAFGWQPRQGETGELEPGRRLLQPIFNPVGGCAS